MAELATTWTAQTNVYFNQGTLANIAACVTQVENNLGRGTLSASTTPTDTEVENWLQRGREEASESFGFTWRRHYAYADTAAGTYRYAMPKDYAGGDTVIRDLTQNKVLSQANPIAMSGNYPDPAGADNSVPTYYAIKDRELWLQAPADGTYRLEIEYTASGDEATADDFTYIPQLIRFRICDFATYRAFMRLQQWNAAQMYKGEWVGGIQQSKGDDSRQKWAAWGFRARNWHNAK